MSRSRAAVLACCLLATGLWLAPRTGSADGTVDSSLEPAARGTTVQVTPTAPSPDGTGRRVIYSKSQQRVWMVEESGRVVRDFRVSGRLDQPDPGTYAVWSRSKYTCSAVHHDVCMRFMVRFAHGPKGGNIGFHEIPVRDGKPLQGDEWLGWPTSDGCVRQSTSDAMFMWDWAQMGTTVVVVP
ncbi:MAG: L,D-transpeptidase [Actinomycetota bacterium]|nr:L,D-transpeptidase [Actinomycetota bacterium]